MAEAPTIGIDWPTDSGGKTLPSNKAVFVAAARGAGDEALAKAMEAEKNWRLGYIPHLQKLGTHLAGSNWKGLTEAGFDKLYETFVVRAADGTTRTLKEVSAMAPAPSVFKTEVVTGKGEGAIDLKVPYKGKVLGEAELMAVLKPMSDVGTHEKDCDQKVQAMAKVDLKGRWFALLGAGSELGPFKFLMERGANVIAIRTRRQAEWEKMKELAAASRGSLYMPVNDKGEYGADILKEPVEIRDWIFSVVQGAQAEVSDITIGAYTYLDGEANVRVSLGCDIIQAGLERLLPSAKVRLAFIGSTGVTCSLSKTMYDAIGQNRAESPCWMRGTGCPAPAHEEFENHHIYHGYLTLQGPNYALAKVMVVWRVLLAKHVSYNNGPPCRTANMVKNPTLKVMLEASELVKPYKSADPEFASHIMGLLLAHDVVVGEPAPQHPFEKTLTSSFHGGTLRFGFNIEESKALSAMLYLYGRCCI